MPFDVPLESQLLSRSKTPNPNASLHNNSSYSDLVIKTPTNTWNTYKTPVYFGYFAETLVAHGIQKMKENVKF